MQGITTAIIVISTIALWVLGYIPVYLTTLLATALLILTDTLRPAEVWQVLQDPILQLLFASLVFAKGLSQSGLSDRVAYKVLGSKFATKNLSNLLLTLGLVSTVLSLLISNTAVTAMMLPVGLTVINSLGLQASRSRIAILLMLTWGSSIAVGILIGTPPNLIAENNLAKLGIAKISFLSWMCFGMPINIIMLLISWWVLKKLYLTKAEAALPFNFSIKQALTIPSTYSNRERLATVIFIVTFSMWLLPDFLSLIFGLHNQTVINASLLLTPAKVALFSVCLMLIIPYRINAYQTLIKFSDLLKVDWRVMFLFFGGLILGQAMIQSGLAGDIGTAVYNFTGASSQLSITALMIGLAIIFSELTSNTAAASILLPFAIALAQQAGINPVGPALGAAFGASFGFMMPISTPPNSIIFSSGLVPIKEMFKAGLIFDLLGFVVILLVLWLVLPMMGWW